MTGLRQLALYLDIYGSLQSGAKEDHSHDFKYFESQKPSADEHVDVVHRFMQIYRKPYSTVA